MCAHVYLYVYLYHARASYLSKYAHKCPRRPPGGPRKAARPPGAKTRPSIKRREGRKIYSPLSFLFDGRVCVRRQKKTFIIRLAKYIRRADYKAR